MLEYTIPFFELIKIVTFFVFLGFFIRNIILNNFKSTYLLKSWTYTVIGIIGIISVIIKGYSFMDILCFVALFFLEVIITPLIENFLENMFGCEFN